jgi:hypothetical protein
MAKKKKATVVANYKVLFHKGRKPSDFVVRASIVSQVSELDGDLDNALIVAPVGANEKQVQAAIKYAMQGF